MRIWDLTDGRLLHTLRGYRDPALGIGTIWSVAFTPDQKSVLVSSADYGKSSHVRIYDTDNLSRIARMMPSDLYPPLQMTFSKDGKWLATVQDSLNSSIDEVVIYHWPEATVAAQFEIPGDQSISYFGFAGGNKVLALLFYESTLDQIYIGDDWKAFDLAEVPRERIERKVSQNGNAIDIKAAKKILDFRAGSEAEEYLEFDEDIGDYSYTSIEIDPTQDRFAMSGEHTSDTGPNYWIRTWATEGGAQQVVYDKHPYRVSYLRFSPDGAWCASSDMLGEIHVWSTTTGELRHRFRSFGHPLYNAGLDSSRKELAFGTHPYGPDQWDVNHYAPLDQALVFGNRQIETPQQSFPKPITDLHGFSVKRVVPPDIRERIELSTPSGETLFAELNNLPYCWNLLPQTEGFGIRGFLVGDVNSNITWVGTTGSPSGRAHSKRFFLGHSSTVFSVTPTADGKLLVSCGIDGLVNIFSLEDLQGWGNIDFEVLDWRTGIISDVGEQAQRDGIHEGDRLVAINGIDSVSVFSLWNSSIDFASKLKVGDVLKLQIERDGQKLELRHKMTVGPDCVEPLLTFFYARTGEWVIWTPQGYYDCSPGGHSLIGWRLNQSKQEESKFYPVDRFRKTLYRPDIIDAVLREGNVERAIKLANQASASPVSEMVDFRSAETLERNEPPEVLIVQPKDELKTEAEEIKLIVEAKSVNDLPIRDITVLLNGRPTESAGKRTSPPSDRMTMRFEVPVKLNAGENVLTAIASNVHANSKPAILKVHREVASSRPNRPKLYILAIGISNYADGKLDLKYPHEDARSFVEMWQGQKAFYESVETKLLINKDATSQKVREAMDWLLESVTQHDIAMIFFASHGVYDARRNYYLATHDAQPDRLRSTAVPYTDITRLIGDMPCKVLMFADTCHSGGITGARAVTDDPWQDLVSEEVGAILFASCHPREVSVESDLWQHGAFTYALLSAMQDPESDVDEDGYVSVSELDLQITKRVKKLTSGQQHPVTQKPATIRNFNLGQLLKP